MKILFNISKISLIICGLVCSYAFGNPKEKKLRDGRCTGSGKCSACRNCSSCQHCNAGGTCGVCSPEKTGEQPKTSAKKRPETKKQLSYPTSKSKQAIKIKD